MTRILIPIGIGVSVLALAWRIIDLISPDAVGMAIGMGLGVVAGLPAAVLVLVALRSSPAPESAVHYYGLENSDHINLRGGGLDGTWRREAIQPPPSVIVVTQPSNTGRFRVAWQPETDETAITPYDRNVIRWAEPVDGVVLAAGVERERRMVWATEPVQSAIASGGLCLVRADEWDAWQRQHGGA